MLADFLNQNIVYEKYNGRDMYGDPSYNAPQTLSARVSYRQKMVYNQIGEQCASFAHVTVEERIEYQDKITLPDGIVRVPLAIRHGINADGSFHHSGVDL